MSSVVIAGNTSGSITISAPDVSGSNTLTLPVATDTLVGKATTDTLTNKTLVAPTITGTLTTTGNTILGDVSTDTLNVGNGGLVKDAGGNVGIGLTPTASVGDLQVSGVAFATSKLYVGAAGSTAFSGGIQNLSNSSRSVSLEADPTNVGASSLILFNIDATEQMRIDSAGLLKFNSGYGSAATAYACRAWVNFDGTGTIAIRASGNVSSITDNGTGNYTVNFTTALVDANYSYLAQAVPISSVEQHADAFTPTTTSLIILTRNNANVSYDAAEVRMSIFR